MSTEHNSKPRIVRHIGESDDGYDLPKPNNRVDYLGQFIGLDDYLKQDLHEYVNTGAAVSDSLWLTDHGANHVARVIQRIDDLTFNGNRCVLSPYETYLVLVAAQFHDVGNLFGRDEHEKGARDIMFDLDDRLVGRDTLEKRMICDIAEAHGGRTRAGDRDTIGALAYDRWVKKLAAILRFADELAEDSTRTSRVVLRAIEETSDRPNVFHLYADRLREVAVDHENSSVRLTFELLKEHLKERCGGRESETYLLDEILGRTLKAHREQVYCGRFMIPDVVSERTEVEICFCTAKYKYVVAKLVYVFEEKGYPDRINDVVAVAPELKGLCGSWVANRCDLIPDEEVEGQVHDLMSLLREGTQDD